MVVLDEHREVLRPAKLWNDTESAPDAAWLIGQLPGGRQAWADACGVGAGRQLHDHQAVVAPSHRAGDVGRAWPTSSCPTTGSRSG